MTFKLSDLFKDSNYKLTQFDNRQIERLEKGIIEKEIKGGKAPYFTCIIRKKDIKLTPEEAVRQLYIMQLDEEYGYPLERMELEYAVSFGREKNAPT